jgi:hypothetical protein
MDTVFLQSLEVFAQAFRRLESQVPKPKLSLLGSAPVLRHKEKSIQQAIVQKLASRISALAASRMLLREGFVQEQSALHRMMDELDEDIDFLGAALTSDSVTDLHRRFLDEFYSEEFTDPDDIVASAQSRDRVPRQKIRAYLQRSLRPDAENPSRELAVAKAIGNFYSGFVHSASPHIMNMCFGSPPRFVLFGMLGTSRIAEHADDSWNYYYRAFVSLIVSAYAFRDIELVRQLYAQVGDFEQRTGRNGGTRGPAP